MVSLPEWMTNDEWPGEVFCECLFWARFICAGLREWKFDNETPIVKLASGLAAHKFLPLLGETDEI